MNTIDMYRIALRLDFLREIFQETSNTSFHKNFLKERVSENLVMITGRDIPRGQNGLSLADELLLWVMNIESYIRVHDPGSIKKIKESSNFEKFKGEWRIDSSETAAALMFTFSALSKLLGAAPADGELDFWLAGVTAQNRVA